MGGSKPLGVLLEHVTQLIGRVGVKQITDGIPVLFRCTRHLFDHRLHQWLHKISHLDLLFVRGVVQVHHFTIELDFHGDRGFGEAGVAFTNNVDEQHHQGGKRNRNRQYAVGPEPALLAVTPFE